MTSDLRQYSLRHFITEFNRITVLHAHGKKKTKDYSIKNRKSVA